MMENRDEERNVSLFVKGLATILIYLRIIEATYLFLKCFIVFNSKFNCNFAISNNISDKNYLEYTGKA